MTWLIGFIALVFGMILGSGYTRRWMRIRTDSPEKQLADSVDRGLLTYEIHRLMMPDGYKGRERDQARFWNGALKSIESFVRSH